ncbi:hypothetical protein FIBSPDRAFT_1053981 [Athelia psychrophila]|uniref:Carbamoyl phosphate synthase ATP-binding domain-containing protein n=1 Tax=Athelia psychrophila TaxID=1759441 RepID=A0A167W2M6_9AGAM|nr:hypothetical protein FIBSPDRAFT_1053981 [Fibularhizoctonia sp. CBS 109695]
MACKSLIYNSSPIAEHKAPTSTQATASSPRALSSPPFLPPGRPDGPAPGTLRIAADMIVHDLAVASGIPDGIRYPVMIDALDGEGRRGMRVVSAEEGVEEALKRCMGESPSGELFADKAVWPGGSTLRVQRRFQNVVETAPFTITRNPVEYPLAASVNMALALRYQGVGTTEYLVNSRTGK